MNNNEVDLDFITVEAQVTPDYDRMRVLAKWLDAQRGTVGAYGETAGDMLRRAADRLELLEDATEIDPWDEAEVAP